MLRSPDQGGRGDGFRPWLGPPQEGFQPPRGTEGAPGVTAPRTLPAADLQRSSRSADQSVPVAQTGQGGPIGDRRDRIQVGLTAQQGGQQPAPAHVRAAERQAGLAQ